MRQEQKLEIAADIAAYIIECSFDGYPYITQSNGDVTYTDSAQELFNAHFDVVCGLLEAE